MEEEFSRLDVATTKISEDLSALAAKVEREIDSRLAQVFGAHQAILDDFSLRDELKKEIADNLVNAGSAAKTVFLRWERRFLLMESQMARNKGADFLNGASALMRLCLPTKWACPASRGFTD